MNNNTNPSFADRESYINHLKQKHEAKLTSLKKKGVGYEFAEYKEQVNPLYQNNPLIAALPRPLSKIEVGDKIPYYPEIPPNLKNFSQKDRRGVIPQVKQLVHPFDTHFKYYDRVNEIIRDGYVGRNPFEIEPENHEERKKIRRQGELSGNIGLFGIPGMGKSTLCREILNLFPQIIFHWRFGERDFLQTQVVWLIVDCPPSASKQDFADAFYRAVDDVVPDKGYFEDYATGQVGARVKNVGTVSKNLCLGLLAFDEMQRLSKVRGGGAKMLLDLLVDFWNDTRIPTFYLGTGQALPLVTPNLHFNRRNANGDIIWERMEEPVWTSIHGSIREFVRNIQPNSDIKGQEFLSLLNILDKYQYLYNPFEINADIGEALYEYSQGITSLAVLLFVLAQQYAIDLAEGFVEGEILDGDTVRSTGAIQFKHLHAALKALESGDPDRIALYEDLIADFDPHSFTNQPPSPPAAPPKTPPQSTKNGSDRFSSPKKPPTSSQKRSTRKKKKRSSQIIYDDLDLRTIAELGKSEHGWTAYQSLKEAGFIANMNEFFKDPHNPFAPSVPLQEGEM